MRKSIYTAELCFQLYALLKLALCGREWSASHSVCFTSVCLGQRLGEPHCWSGQGDECKSFLWQDSTSVAGPIASYNKHLHKHNAVCTPRMTYFINDLLYLVSLWQLHKALVFKNLASTNVQYVMCDCVIMLAGWRFLNRYIFYLCITAPFSLQYVWF